MPKSEAVAKVISCLDHWINGKLKTKICLIRVCTSKT